MVPNVGGFLPLLKKKLLQAPQNKDPEVQAYIKTRSAIADYFLHESDNPGNADEIKKKALKEARNFYEGVRVKDVTVKEFKSKQLSLAHRKFHFWSGDDNMLPVGQTTIISLVEEQNGE